MTGRLPALTQGPGADLWVSEPRVSEGRVAPVSACSPFREAAGAGAVPGLVLAQFLYHNHKLNPALKPGESADIERWCKILNYVQ